MENKLKVSVVITVKNEDKSISKLLDSLEKQELMPLDIVIIDAKSIDKTVQIVNDYQKRYKNIRLQIKKCTRAEGRNIGIKMAKNNIIAMTDAGCVADKTWLNYLVKPFNDRKIEVVAGFYKMKAKTNLQKLFSVYLGVSPSEFNDDFLPSTRSIAFRKSTWKKVGEFPEELNDTAEDTVFNYNLVKKGVKIERAKNATVEWEMPKTIIIFYKKMYSYAKGDASTKIYLFPGKGIMSHNIKVLLVILRYTAGLVLLIYSLVHPTYLVYVLILLAGYILWSSTKVYSKTNILLISMCSPVVQIVADISVMHGFINGIIRPISLQLH
jgi:cellulose synthase/poly-beta-1,6-N-acetylglucosamine synthase-like glycosyltransferase